ncbi:MAG: zinc dependent phospholipase C family protein [Clostridium sp.]|nr:zinc dependent phospholipase C family protein [Clostridium sp.]
MGLKVEPNTTKTREPATLIVKQNTSSKHKSSKREKGNAEYRTLHNASGGTKEAQIGGVLTKTHTYIMKQALAILKNDKGFSCLNEDKYTTILLVYTDWPDRLGCETDHVTWAGHFYHPKTGVNYKGQSAPTALSRAVSHFDNAVKQFKAGHQIEAIELLGKGTHYVGDLNEPHHASNVTAVSVGGRHYEFEKYADLHCREYYFENDTIDQRYYEEAKKIPISQSLKKAAIIGHSYLDKAQNRNTYHEAAEVTIKNSIVSVVQYLYKFGVIIGIYE